jgi:peptidoglycan/LPS O-acetylase OafA/YrhL
MDIKSPHIPQLDGLRGLAIFLVVGQHYFGFFPVFSFGWSGLDLFFVLSGYLITGRLLAKSRSPGYFSNFYRNRALRILPLYYGVLLLFFAGIHFVARKENLSLMSYYTIHWKSFFFFTENWTYIIYGAPKATYLVPFWSLAAEEQFYLVWPVLLYLLVSNRSRIKLCLAIPPVVMIIRMAIYFSHFRTGNWNGMNIFFNTFCRIDSFAIGALLCEFHHARVRISDRVVNLFLSLTAAALVISYSIFMYVGGGYNAFFGTVGNPLTAMLWACILHKSLSPSVGITGKFFRLRGLRFLGKISYGLYVFHFPIILLFQTRIVDWGMGHLSWSASTMKIPAIACCLLISLLLSMLSYRYYESFFLRLKKR